MSDYQKPKNPKKAGIVIVAIAAAIFLVIFVGLNLRNADDSGAIDVDPTDPPAGATN
ncbi:hypothetical protein [Falsirhodobacter xinxiangensis]|uniref:hypothetical protein n=1 Tax=Falsirhodobacter xinxiangensis TaxID=2530049 RepID=UPI00145ABDE3|nr:hypothetical protein [Rhodobacter xinxiangensis]